MYPASPTLRYNYRIVKLSHTWAYPKCSQHTQTHLHIRVDCGGIHNCQVLESTLVSTNRWKDKENKWNIHDRVLFSYKEQNYIICRKIELKTIMLHKISHMTSPPPQLVTSSLRCWQPRDFTAILVNTTIWHPQEITTPFEFPVAGHSVTYPNPLLSVGFYLPTCLWHHGNRRPLSCDKVSAFPTSLRRPDINNTRPPLWIKFFWHIVWHGMFTGF